MNAITQFNSIASKSIQHVVPEQQSSPDFYSMPTFESPPRQCFFSCLCRKIPGKLAGFASFGFQFDFVASGYRPSKISRVHANEADGIFSGLESFSAFSLRAAGIGKACTSKRNLHFFDPSICSINGFCCGLPASVEMKTSERAQ